jgi:hypothetical protein
MVHIRQNLDRTILETSCIRSPSLNKMLSEERNKISDHALAVNTSQFYLGASQPHARRWLDTDETEQTNHNGMWN